MNSETKNASKEYEVERHVTEHHELTQREENEHLYQVGFSLSESCTWKLFVFQILKTYILCPLSKLYLW